MRVKYNKEVCFALSVAMVRTLDGKVKGRQCKAYNYTQKIIVPDAEFMQKVREEIIWVKSLA